MIRFQKQKNIIMKNIIMKNIKIKKRKTGGIIAAAMLVLLLWLSGCSGQVTEYEAADTAMGTVVWQKVYAREDITPEILAQITNLETELLSKREADSEIGRLNASAGKEEVTVSQELTQLLQQVWEISAKSGGALDVTVSPAVDLWNIDSCAMGTAPFVLPGEAQLQEALTKIGYEKVQIGEETIELPEGMSLDLGAVGKGIACDFVARLLERDFRVEGAVISVGGSVVTYGSKPDGRPWVIGIQNPRPEEGGGSYIGSLSLEGSWFVATSGDYERYVMQDGKRYHHILNPQTGYPAESGLISVTVLSKSGLLSDALSTACFVLGKEAGFALAEDYEAYILVVDTEGNVEFSEGMERYFTP